MPYTIPSVVSIGTFGREFACMGKYLRLKVAKDLVNICRHTDYGTTTLLFSVPVTALQIWKDDRWKFVPYKAGALVINLGETLEGRGS